MLAKLFVTFGVALQLLGKFISRMQDPDRSNAAVSAKLLNDSLREGRVLLASGCSIFFSYLCRNVPDGEEPAGRGAQQPFGQRLCPPDFGAFIIHLQDI